MLGISICQIRETADAVTVTKISLGDRLAKLQDTIMVNMTTKMVWFQRTFIKNLEVELLGQYKN
jgi:hypothetical protein